MKSAVVKGRAVASAAAAKRRAKRLKEGVGPAGRAADAAALIYEDGRASKAASYVLTGVSGWLVSGGAPFVRSPELQAYLRKVSIPAAGLAATTKKLGDRQKGKSLTRALNSVSLHKFLGDRNNIRDLERNLVRRYALNPRGIAKYIKAGSHTQVAEIYAFLHSMRRLAPSDMKGGSYRIGRQETPEFSQMVVPALLHRLNQVPKKSKKHIPEILRAHDLWTALPPEDRALIMKGEMGRFASPAEHYKYVPTVLENETPGTVDEAVSLALFEAAIAKVKREGIVKP